MKLYYAPGACSLSPHIVLYEAGLPFTAVKVNTKTHSLPDGSSYLHINPLGYVPLLELANGSVPRYQLQSWLHFIGTELHKGFGPLFNPATPADYKPLVIERLLSRLAWVDQQLEGRAYLMGEQFSVADAYLFTVTGWAKLVKLDLSGLQNIAYFRQRMSARPGVHAALQAEGLIA